MTVLHDSLLRAALDYAGVAVFAATGALAAARRGYDIITFAFFAAITGIGGGTLRDLLIGAPVFWIADPGYVAVCIAAAGLVWAVGEKLSRLRTLLWLDALGIAAYCVVGASKAAAWGVPPLVSVVMGVLTATFGGMVRDVLAGEPSVLLRKEIYVTATVSGACGYVIARWAGFPDGVAAVFGVAVAFALRAGALSRGWTLPGYGATLDVQPAPAVQLTPRAPAAAPETDPVSEPTAVAEASPPTKPRRPRKPRAKPVEVVETPVLVEPPPPTPSRRPRKPRADG